MSKKVLQNKYSKWLLVSLRLTIFLLFFIAGIYTVQSFTEPASGPSIVEPTNIASSSDTYVNLGVTNSVTANTVTIFNYFRQIYTNIGGSPSSATRYTLDGGNISDLIGTTTPDTANGKTVFNYLKLIDDTLDFPELGSVLSSDTVKNSSGSISNCTGGDASCYASGGKWYSTECVDSTTGTKTSCYVDDTAKYIDADVCSAASDTGYCYINAATLSAMDADLTAAKIKNGEVIFGITGTYYPLDGTSCKQIKTDTPASASGAYWIDTNGGSPSDAYKVYCDMTTDGGGWTLVMKLRLGSFCYGSSKWTDGVSFNSTDTISSTTPTRDSKSDAFSNLSNVTELRFETVSGEVTVDFDSAATSQNLITTNDVAFTSYPNYANWVTTFYQGRSSGPIFMRAGTVVTDPAGCRANPGSTPLGCGQACTFCYQASDGGPSCGTASANDTNSGIGNNASYCGAGTGTYCSTGGNWSNNANATIIWAR